MQKKREDGNTKKNEHLGNENSFSGDTKSIFHN